MKRRILERQVVWPRPSVRIAPPVSGAELARRMKAEERALEAIGVVIGFGAMTGTLVVLWWLLS